MASKVAVVFLASFFLVFFNTYSGLLSINEEFVRLARLMGATWPQTVGRVILPAAAHQIFLGLRTAVPYAVIGAVIGEYIGSHEGLGYFILYASQTYDAPALFSGIIILVAIVFVANFCLELAGGSRHPLAQGGRPDSPAVTDGTATCLRRWHKICWKSGTMQATTNGGECND